ncbi:hAT family dimerization domain containing protein [Panicum miliaceum]|uniref:HAT family dimerization domain containing protein n=1 Tax=Panicum miliaceum TaxID=4540 RepID=A0A3L6SUS6_PANMI|nr:hAT family dimerization domain containing protein [Panicum miliaceum]
MMRSNPVVDDSSTENDESIEVEEEPEPVDEELPEEAEPPVHDVGSLPLEHDPGIRMPISSFDVNEQDAARRGYILKGACQPHAHEYPITTIYGKDCCFSLIWFYNYPWIEYSVEKDAAFCFTCYLFGKESGKFVTGGWNNWNVGTIALTKHGNSKGHKFAQEKLNLFLKKNTKIDTVIVKASDKENLEYKARLTYSLRCLRFLLRQGLACRGHDETEESHNRGNFLELLKDPIGFTRNKQLMIIIEEKCTLV